MRLDRMVGVRVRRDALAILVVTLSLVGAGCAPPDVDEGSAITALGEQWSDAFNAGDVDTLVGLYTEDARVLPPNAELGQGRDAIRASFAEMVDAGLGGTTETIEARTAGDLGYRVGTYIITDGDGAEIDRGKFVETWQRTDAGWKIANDIYNSDTSTAPEGTTQTIIGVHEVRDADKWLAAWSGPDSRHALFLANGATDVRVFQSPEHPKTTGLLIEVEDMEALQAMLASPEGIAAKKADGVIDKTLRILTEVQ